VIIGPVEVPQNGLIVQKLLVTRDKGKGTDISVHKGDSPI